MLKIVPILAVALACTFQASAAAAVRSWNELVGAQDGLFPSEFNTIQSKSLGTEVLVSELNGLLGQDTVLNAIYRNYLTQYNKEPSRFRSRSRSISSSASKKQFRNTLVAVAEHNLEAQKGKYSWTEGVNQFTDMSPEEYATYLTYSMSFSELYAKSNFTNKMAAQKPANHYALKKPSSVSWREYLTPVREQKGCGSCYAFAAIGQLEAHFSIQNNGRKLDLSEQLVVDCSVSVGNEGCDGGDLTNTAKFLEGGSVLEANYPYTAKFGECQKNAPLAEPIVLTQKDVNSELDLQEELARGPVTVAIDGSCYGFQNYKSGILTECGQHLSHAVLAVGYESEGELPYYEIKNSWGTRWGDQGFIKIAAGSGVAGIGMTGSQISTN